MEDRNDKQTVGIACMAVCISLSMGYVALDFTIRLRTSAQGNVIMMGRKN